MKNKLLKLEAVRGFAAIYVVLHHSFSKGLIIGNYNFSFLFKYGQEAVILFFILSGFVIKYSFERSANKTFSDYFSKRFLRIYIPLIVVFITNYLLLSYYAHSFIGAEWKTLLGNLFMLQDIPSLKLNVICGPYLNNDPLWSLSYEWWFYMLFYFFITKLKQKATLVVFILAILSSISYIFYPFFINRLLIYFAIWWSGVEIADIYLTKKTFSISNMKASLLTLGACLFALLINAYFNSNNGLAKGIGISPKLEVRHFGFTIVVILLAILWNKFNWKFFNITFGPFKFFAPVSYVMYVSHHFLVTDTSYLSFLNGFYLKFIVGFAICLLYSYLVELKYYKWMRDLILKGKASVKPKGGKMALVK
ncbi:acyltransferase family protein [Mucilaginibacter sp.]|uniref:acyltransferase family protein n=1 Tax=Mucilaginibacter sp. TaxID=1882438 RepID=UPI003D0ABFAF